MAHVNCCKPPSNRARRPLFSSPPGRAAMKLSSPPSATRRCRARRSRAMSPVFLVARRDYFAYVGAWGFWLSLITAPLIIALLMFAPIFLARAEPPRVLAILAEQPADADVVRNAFIDVSRREARGVINAYIDAAAPAVSAVVAEA